MISLSHYCNSPKRRSPAPRWSSSDSPVWFFSRQTYRRTYCIFIYFFWFVLSLFICIFLTVLFVSISQVIGCEDRLRNDLYCVEWGVKLYSNQPAYHIVHIPAKGEGACRLRLEVAYGMPNARPSGAHGRQQADRHSDRHTHRQTQTLRQDNGAVAIGRIWLLLWRCLTREKSKNNAATCRIEPVTLRDATNGHWRFHSSVKNDKNSATNTRTPSYSIRPSSPECIVQYVCCENASDVNEAEARKSEDEANAEAEWFGLEATWALKMPQPSQRKSLLTNRGRYVAHMA